MISWMCCLCVTSGFVCYRVREPEVMCDICCFYIFGCYILMKFLGEIGISMNHPVNREVADFMSFRGAVNVRGSFDRYHSHNVTVKPEQINIMQRTLALLK